MKYLVKIRVVYGQKRKKKHLPFATDMITVVQYWSKSNNPTIPIVQEGKIDLAKEDTRTALVGDCIQNISGTGIVGVKLQ